MQPSGAGELPAGCTDGRSPGPGLLRGTTGGHRGRAVQQAALQRPHHPHPRLQPTRPQIRTQVVRFKKIKVIRIFLLS